MRTRRPTLRITLVATMIATLFAGITVATAASAATSGFKAAGSARQVYATGIKPGARIQLVNRAGDVVAKRRANSLGGALFRNVRPGTGYRVHVVGGRTSKALTVHTNSPKQWNPAIYKQPMKSASAAVRSIP